MQPLLDGTLYPSDYPNAAFQTVALEVKGPRGKRQLVRCSLALEKGLADNGPVPSIDRERLLALWALLIQGMQAGQRVPFPGGNPASVPRDMGLQGTPG